MQQYLDYYDDGVIGDGIFVNDFFDELLVDGCWCPRAEFALQTCKCFVL
jgi:hypothetical protein